MEGLLAGNTNMEGSFASCYELMDVLPKDLHQNNLEPFDGHFCTFRLLFENPDESHSEDQFAGLPSFSPLALRVSTMY